METPDGELEWFFSFEGLGYEVAVHDNGCVAYAYLHDYNNNDNIISYTWLYNRCQAPRVPEWVIRKEDPPYAMPANLIENNIGFKLPTKSSDVDVGAFTDGGKPPYFAIYLEKEVLGLLDPKTHPGWARLVRTDSPIARAFDEGMLSILKYVPVD